MEISEDLSQQERLHAIAEKRKRLTEIENKTRQLEDDKRKLQYLKAKALREQWLLDGMQSAGPEQDEANKQLQQSAANTKELEETIIRLKQELEELEVDVSAIPIKESLSDMTQEEVVKTADKKAPDSSVEVQSLKEPLASDHGGSLDFKVLKSPCLVKCKGDSDMMMKAMYSVEITVERDKVTGETKVLSTNTLLPVDLSQQGVKVYEDELKVVHEVNGENGVHLLSSSEVEELIHKADEVSMISKPADDAIIPATKTESLNEFPEQQTGLKKEITGIETKSSNTSSEPDTAVSIPGASSDNPVTMVFMGYQNVEDEAETKKVLGLERTVKAELVIIDNGAGKTLPKQMPSSPLVAQKDSAKQEQSAPPNGNTPVTDPVSAAASSTSDEKGEPEKGTYEPNKEKPCKCCTIM